VARTAVARYQVEIAWLPSTTANLLILGTSTLGNNDVLSAGYGVDYGGTFEDLTAQVEQLRITRGRSDAFGAMQAGSCSIDIRDPGGKYNPTNPASPLYGYLEPFRAVRITGHYGTATYADTVFRDAPIAYWRLADADSTIRSEVGGHHLALSAGAGSTAGLLTSDANAAHAFTAQYALDADSPAALDGAFFKTNFAVEFLIKKASAPASTQTILQFGCVDVDVLSSGLVSVTLSVLSAGSLVPVAASGGTTVCNNATHHVLVKYDGAFIDVWRDGTRVVHQAETRPLYLADASRMAVGVRMGADETLGQVFTGTLDEVAVYGYALSDARITAHRNASIATFETRRWPIFFGLTRTGEAVPAPRRGVSLIEANDLFLWLSRGVPTMPSTGPTTTGAAIKTTLEAVAFADTTFMALDVGDSFPDFDAEGTASALSVIEELLEAERGVFFIDAAGRATYRSRNTWALDTVAGAIASEMSAVAPGFDLDRVRNKATVTRTVGGTEGTPKTYEDTESVRKYGPADAGALSTRYLNSDAEAEGLAQYLVASQKTPVPPLWRLRIDNRTAALLTLCLSLELQDLVTVTEAKTGTTGTFRIEQISHEIRGRDGRHTVDYLLSSLPPAPFIIGTSQVGGAQVLGH
jgi:hypothetical protein